MKNELLCKYLAPDGGCEYWGEACLFSTRQKECDDYESLCVEKETIR